MKKIIFLLLISLSALGQSRLPWLQSHGYCSEYQNYINYLNTNSITQPSSQTKAAQNQFVIDLKDAGIWPISDHLKIMATDGATRSTDINLISPGVTYTSTRVASPVHTLNDGIKFNGTSSYINTGWTPNGSTNYTQNSAEQIIYLKDITVGTTLLDGTRSSSANNVSSITPYYASGQANYGTNGTGTTTVSDATFDGTNDLYFWGRTSSSSQFIKKGGNSRLTASNTSTTPSTRTFKIGVFDNNGTINLFNNRKVGMFWSGALLTTTQETQFKAAWDKYLTSIASIPVPTLGVQYSKTSWSDLSDFTNSTTASIVSNNIQCSGGAGTWTQRLDLPAYAMVKENWQLTALITVGTKTTTSFGFGLGCHSINAAAQNDFSTQFDMRSNGTTGQVLFSTGANGTFTQRNISSTGLTFSVGDQISIDLVRAKNIVTVRVYNVTTDPTATTVKTATYTYPATSTPYLPNTAIPCIYNFGGTWTLNSLIFQSSELKNLKYAFIGDSKTQGYFASNYDFAFPVLTADYLGFANRLGGGNDRTADYLNRTQEIIDLAPQIVIMGGVSNDPRNSVSAATTQSNYSSFVSTLQGAGIRVVHTTGFYETSGIDQATFRTWLLSTYNASDIIDTLPTTITLNADGIHPDDTGHASISNMIVTSGKLSIN